MRICGGDNYVIGIFNFFLFFSRLVLHFFFYLVAHTSVNKLIDKS